MCVVQVRKHKVSCSDFTPHSHVVTQKPHDSCRHARAKSTLVAEEAYTIATYADTSLSRSFDHYYSSIPNHSWSSRGLDYLFILCHFHC